MTERLTRELVETRQMLKDAGAPDEILALADQLIAWSDGNGPPDFDSKAASDRIVVWSGDWLTGVLASPRTLQ